MVSGHGGAGPADETVMMTAQRGRTTPDTMASACLPLVYNVVGRAMNGHPAVGRVVRETMIRAIRGTGDWSDTEAFRSRAAVIAIRLVREFYVGDAAGPAEEDGPDFEDLTIDSLGLSGQRREIAEASRWLDDEDGPLVALWWQEAAGELARGEVADALGLSPAHAAIAIARMTDRLTIARVVVRALRQAEPCRRLMAAAAGWDRDPSPQWRDRLAAHVYDCQVCRPGPGDMTPGEQLLSGLALVPVPAALASAALRSLPGADPGEPRASGRGAGRADSSGSGPRTPRGHRGPARPGAALAPLLGRWRRSTVIAAAVAVVLFVSGVAFALTRGPGSSPAVASGVASSVRPSGRLATMPGKSPRAVPSGRAVPGKKPSPKPSSTLRAPVAPAVAGIKGVSTEYYPGVDADLENSGATWWYNWGPAPSGVSAPHASFVPMIWGPANVNSATLSEVKQEGNILLGFNEPDQVGQSDMTVSEALNLWPQLESTGMELGSPAVSWNASLPGGWLDQFMTGARARGYRVNFIALHWYGQNNWNDIPVEVANLKAYVQAAYDRYHLPIWLTEFSLIHFSGQNPTYPPPSTEGAFLASAAQMLRGLGYVQRYAWFGLPANSETGNTGLFANGAATPVGRAFEQATP